VNVTPQLSTQSWGMGTRRSDTEFSFWLSKLEVLKTYQKWERPVGLKQRGRSKNTDREMAL